MSLKARLNEDVKTALRARDKARLGVLRMTLAAIKQREVDERIELDDAQVTAVIEKMIKQRRDSIAQYQQAGREELAAREQAEIDVIQAYLPEALPEEEVAALIEQAIAATGAAGMRDMGKVMGQRKAKLQERADMGAVSAMIKYRLG